MKILMLSDINSSHTIKWVKSLLKNEDIDIFLYSFTECKDNTLINNLDRFKYSSLNLTTLKTDKYGNYIYKLKYFKAIFQIKKLIKQYKPDLVHAHFLSSYGLIASLLNFKPFIVSVWGYDIFDFPRKSFVHKIICKFVLKRATKILSTSNVMAKETQKYTNKSISVTPFGIDVDLFKPEKTELFFSENTIVIGTVKSIDIKYGTEYLVKAFSIVKNKFPTKSLKLLIVGGYAYVEYYNKIKTLIKNLDLEADTVFIGKINPTDCVKYHNIIDIFVALSLTESFGVAVLEASACSKPVVVSNVGGLPEVVKDGTTGYIVESCNENQAADSISKLIEDSTLRNQIGINGREHVLNLYNWTENVQRMIEIYKSFNKKI